MPPDFGLGTQGKPTTWHCTSAFEDKLDACFAQLWEVCPLGKADVICTAGVWVDKTGMHGKGRAFDLDAVFWGDRLVLANNYPNDRVAYLGIEAILRKHFGTVLNYKYNAAHQDHWHIDDGSSVGFQTSSESRVKFLQMALNSVYAAQPVLSVDGDYGRKTRGAAREVLLELQLVASDQLAADSDVDRSLKQVWLALLDETARRGLNVLAPAREGQEPTAQELLERLYGVILEELEETEARKRIETAVTTFVSHPTISSALD
jgi:hypothetical protein